ncbi:MAG: fucose pyrophosphorylase domain-containing protein, partial [Candidatus Poribacteria bacterium]
MMRKPDEKKYDICVITSANEYQAIGYRERIRIKKENGELPKETEFIVISDPDGKRIGSGGSTIYVLYKLIERYTHLESNKKFNSIRDILFQKRILILHSGGDSKRLPAYSATGKIFFPLPLESFSIVDDKKQNRGFITVFDVLLNNLMKLPYTESGQLVVASGDVLLSFDTSEVKFNDCGITGIAYLGSANVASGHGVYIPDQAESDQNLRLVANFLQKPSYEQLIQNKALDESNRAFIDTGILHFSIDALEKIVSASGVLIDNGKLSFEEGSLCERLIKGQVCFDIYKEIPYMLLNYDLATLGFQELKFFANSLNNITFFVCLLSYCDFFHIGTSKQLLRNFHTINHTASMYGFRNFSRSKIKNPNEIKNIFIYNSLIESSSIKSGRSSFIEGCYIKGGLDLSGENIITGITEDVGEIRLKNGICISCIPVIKPEVGWVTIIYGVNDNFGLSMDDSFVTFLNKPLADWIKENNINESDLWSGKISYNLWNAQLFPFSIDISESVKTALDISDGNFDNWKKSDRMSMEEIINAVDYKRFLDNYTELGKKVNLERLSELLIPKSELSSEEILSWCKDPRDYRKAEEQVLSITNKTDNILYKARLYKLLSNIVRKSLLLKIYENPKSERVGYYEEIAYNLVLSAIKKGLESVDIAFEKFEPAIKIRSDEVVWVCASTRLDFAGGWSDTPPYCLEYGGSVLNASVNLNGQYPIQVIGKLYKEPCIRINSIDLGESVTITDIQKMLSYKDPSDWTSLPKAAFTTIGIISEGIDIDLQEFLKKLGAGIDLTLFSAVPSGSGLGTSSILGSAIIACLSRIFGQELTSDELFNYTLYMEQLMTTGGGWQDQIGGVIGGVKLIQTEPGLFQVPKISWTDLKVKSNMNLSDRFLLYYTGYRRMAKNILRNIVGKYLDRDETTIKTIGQLKEKSYEMKLALDHRDIDTFGKMINEVWELNKILDPGTSNDDIESIIDK